ncbi:V-type ATP synthase subunit D [Methanofollis fontis]|uniref:A-type ATP synthase subunit D n=1 Tax=Methanofollis fontis TaxID=2052832 RepID=A0A483CVA7_9EURY|nr:V-type ATP synthase subunit D [Methanofollis fontis]TAJ45576.1 V-type ATP synthase subunit D [Methanofollis fontis]
MSRRIIPGTRPTRIELLKIRKRIVVAGKGHELLQEKLDAMVMEFFRLRGERERLRQAMEEAFAAAYPPLLRAGMVMGERGLDIALGCAAPAREIGAGTRTVMGTAVPALRLPPPGTGEPGYPLAAHGADLDEGRRRCEEAVRAALRCAEAEGALVRLAEQIATTRRRTNALAYVLLPSLRDTAAYIEGYLEEMEREDLYRRKRTKAIRAEAEGA